jgi:hypothetical protein
MGVFDILVCIIERWVWLGGRDLEGVAEGGGGLSEAF